MRAVVSTIVKLISRGRSTITLHSVLEHGERGEVNGRFYATDQVVCSGYSGVWPISVVAINRPCRQYLCVYNSNGVDMAMQGSRQTVVYVCLRSRTVMSR